MEKRKTNFEALRLVSMVLIIGHHFAVHGGFYFHSPVVTGNMLFLQLLNVGGKVGVNLFVLISGYFLSAAKSFRREKAVKLWLQIAFYSVTIYGIACLTGLAEFSFVQLGRSCLPILSKQWWFASAWFVMYLLSPALNRGLRKLNRRGYLCLLGALTVLWCVIPVLTWLPERLRDVAWFVYLYSVAGFLRLHCNGRAQLWFILGLAAFGAAYGYAVVRLYLMAGSMAVYETTYFNMFELQILLPSVLLFQGFAAWECKPSRRINALAALSFGVYLIHDSDYLRYPLWQGLANCASFLDSPLLVPYALMLTAGVYLVCGGVEQLRKVLLERPFDAVANVTRRRKP